MRSAWKEVRLGDVILFNPKENLRKGTVGSKIGMDRLQPFTRSIPSHSAEPYNGGSKFRNGDTIMARITPCLENGKTAQVSVLSPGEVGFGSTEYIVMRNIDGVTEKDYVYYLATSPVLREIAIKSMVGSSGRQRVQQSVLEDYIVLLPSIEEQHGIATTLSCLDDKIELNNKINANLEAQAHAIFRSLFVDFEPFQNSEFVDSELGKIPKGWRVGVLSDIATLNAGGDRPTLVSRQKTSICSVPIYSNGLDNYGLYGYTNKAKIHKESVTVSARGTIGFVCLREEPYVPIVRLVSLTPNANCVTAKYLFHWLKQINISGTGTTQQQLTVPAFKKTKVLIPQYDIVQKFTELVDSFYLLKRDKRSENERLAALRDTLLPKLMSGEIEVSTAEAIIHERS